MRRASSKLALCATLVVTALSTTAVVPAPSHAGSTQENIFNDAILFQHPERWAAAASELKALGVQSFFQLVSWRSLAPSPSSPKVPKRFRRGGSAPGDYSSGRWAPYDRFIAMLNSEGIDVTLNLTGPAPRWANKGRVAATRSFSSVDPNRAYFQRFAKAVGQRYPAVRRWSCWNEPNLLSWIEPQFKYSPILGRTIPASPQIYRGLYGACSKGLRASGHGRDEILLGETSPRTPTPVSLTPGEFWRELLCMNRRLIPFKGAEARARGCPGRLRLQVKAVSHHPYLLKLSPFARPGGSHSDWIPIGALNRLTKILDAAARHRTIPRDLPLYLTEFGVESNPPDPKAGVSLERQAADINLAQHIAFDNANVAGWSQYELCDQAVSTGKGGGVGGFQTGLRFANCAPKPALDAYRLPIDVRRKGLDRVRVWGAATPVARGAPARVSIESSSGGAFTTDASFVVANAQGYFDVDIERAGASKRTWRLSWKDAAGTIHRSRAAAAR